MSKKKLRKILSNVLLLGVFGLFFGSKVGFAENETLLIPREEVRVEPIYLRGGFNPTIDYFQECLFDKLGNAYTTSGVLLGDLNFSEALIDYNGNSMEILNFEILSDNLNSEGAFIANITTKDQRTQYLENYQVPVIREGEIKIDPLYFLFGGIPAIDGFQSILSYQNGNFFTTTGAFFEPSSFEKSGIFMTTVIACVDEGSEELSEFEVPVILDKGLTISVLRMEQGTEPTIEDFEGTLKDHQGNSFEITDIDTYEVNYQNIGSYVARVSIRDTRTWITKTYEVPVIVEPAV